MQPSLKLRADLEVSEQRTRDATVYVLKEPSGGRIFRLPEIGWFIARQLDGRRAPEDIRRRTEERFGDRLSAEELDSYVAELEKLGLLEGAAQGAPPLQSQRDRIRGDLLYLRFKAFDPDRRLDRLLPAFQWCFTPGFVACSIALVAFGLALAAANWSEIEPEFAGLLRIEGLAYAWFVLILSVCAHELAHALTCKHFGGRVREMGFMLIYFQPALYCNVSDAWMFPEKSKRLWVTFAGAWLDLVLFALAVLVWRATETEASLHFAALVVLATAGIRMLFNFNPLIKLDGYYLLSDALEIPNLRRRAFAYLGSLWRQFGGERIAAKEETGTARERRIYIAYGLLAGGFSLFLLGSVIWWFAAMLVERYRGAGFLLFLALVGVIFRHPLRRLLSTLPERIRKSVSLASMSPRGKLVAAGAGLLGAALLIPAPLTVSGGFATRPVDNADIRADVDGIIEAVLVDEGDTVAAGAIIARLGDRDRRGELAQLVATIRERQAKLKMLRAGHRPEEMALARQRLETARTRESEAANRHAEAQRLRAARIAGARASVAKAREQLQFSEYSASRLRPLVAQGFHSPVKFKEAESEISVRRKALDEAEAVLRHALADEMSERREDQALARAARTESERELERMLAGSRPEDIEAAEAELASLDARRRMLQENIERLAIRSPHAGVVTTPRLKEKIGQYVSRGELIAEVFELKRITVDIEVPEKDIGPVRIGNPVALKARAYPGETFRGEVTAIASATHDSNRLSAARMVRVVTSIDNPEMRLKAGMTGYAKIDSGTRSLFEVLSHSFVGALRVEVWSWWF